MKIVGKIVLERKIPSVIELKYPLNVFRKPELYLSFPTTAIYIRAFLCKDKSVKFETEEVLFLTESRKNILDWSQLKLSEYSPKYINSIVLVQDMANRIELTYELLIPDTD